MTPVKQKTLRFKIGAAYVRLSIIATIEGIFLSFEIYGWMVYVGNEPIMLELMGYLI